MELSREELQELLSIIKNKLENIHCLEENRALLFEHIEDRLMSGEIRPNTAHNVYKFLGVHLLPNINKSFLMCTARDLKKAVREYRLRHARDSTATFVGFLKPFFKWLRREYGYPENYPDRERVETFFMLTDTPQEVTQLKAKRTPLRQRVAKNIKKLPRDDSVTWELVKFANSKRDQALIAMFAENGNRPDGLLNLRVGDVVIADGVAEVYIHDKTLQGELIIFVEAVPYLLEWLDAHPHADRADAPLFPSSRNPSKPLSYGGFYQNLKRVVRKYNEWARLRHLPEIKISPRTFRNIATRRDIKRGLQPSIIKRQRGWSPSSTMPELYAAISGKDVKDVLVNKTALGKCPRCGLPSTGDHFCRRCSEPLTPEARDAMKQVDRIVVAVLKDERLRERVFEMMEKEVIV